MVRVPDKALGFFLPALTDVLIGGKSFHGLEALGEAIGHQESIQVFFQVLMGLVVILFHCDVFECAVHAFYLAISPGMVGCGQPMVDAMLLADAIKDMLKGVLIAVAVSELDAIIGQHSMDFVRYGSDQVP